MMNRVTTFRPTLTNNLRRFIGSCCAKGYFDETEHGDKAFSIRTVNLKYGKVLEEVGVSADELLDGKKNSRVALFTDRNIKQTEHFQMVHKSLAALFEVHVYDKTSIEPTDVSFMEAAEWCKDVKPNLCVSLGGGSVMDTTKAAILYSCHPPPKQNGFLYYVNKPVGEGVLVPKRGLPPHIAIPTTSGTGSECTGFAICKLTEHPTAALSKTGIASEALCPTLAMVDPRVTLTMPSMVVASSGFDVLCHAIESFTARPFTKRPIVEPAHVRPLNQGANPYSDFACMETFRICGEFFERAIVDPTDFEARERMLWASTIVGTAMGNCGVAIPHGLSYPVCGHVKHYTPASGYPKDHPLIPHGMGVGICAPAAIRKTGPGCPERHLKAAQLLQAHHAGEALLNESGEVLAQEVVRLLQIAGFPKGIYSLGFNSKDLPSLASACFQQKRVINNSPVALTEEDILDLYHHCESLEFYEPLATLGVTAQQMSIVEEEGKAPAVIYDLNFFHSNGYGKNKPLLGLGAGDSALYFDVIDDENFAVNGFTLLDEEVPWARMRNRGEAVKRLIAIQGTVETSAVSGLQIEPLYRHPADEQPKQQLFTPVVDQFRKLCEPVVGHPLNHVLIQKYRNGKDNIGEHADKSLDITKNSNISNLSFGATRVMILRAKKDDKSEVAPRNQRITLPSNSLFVLGWETNKLWKHQIRQDKRKDFLKSADELLNNGQRISLTFRNISTFLREDGRLFGQGAKFKSEEELNDDNKPNTNLEEESLEMLKAFSKENHSPTFDWNQHYGSGYEVLNFKILNCPDQK